MFLFLTSHTNRHQISFLHINISGIPIYAKRLISTNQTDHLSMIKFSHICGLLLTVACLLVSCKKATYQQSSDKTDSLTYSQLLHIEQHDGYRLVTISDPWQDNAILHQYALVPTESKMPTNLPDGIEVLRTPLKRMCVSTSVHASLFRQLDATANISSVCDAEYIMDTTLVGLVGKGNIGNAGSSMNPNIETIMRNNTDAILMSPFKGASYGLIEKTGISIIECADYMETSALGRAEWIKFYGMLVGKESEANNMFRTICDHYLALKKKAQSAASHPKLLVDMLNAGTWYLPDGGSTYGMMFADAGADYQLGDPKLSGTQSLSLEKVITQAIDADIWLIKYGQAQDYSYSSLGRENKAYSQFKAFKQHKVYGCNTLKIPFYEEVPFHPDLLMADIIKILHPELLPDHTLRYYTPLSQQ